MKKFMALTKQFRDDENGAAMIEYSILIGLISALVIATIVVVGTWVDGAWTDLEAELNPPAA